MLSEWQHVERAINIMYCILPLLLEPTRYHVSYKACYFLAYTSYLFFLRTLLHGTTQHFHQVSSVLDHSRQNTANRQQCYGSADIAATAVWCQWEAECCGTQHNNQKAARCSLLSQSQELIRRRGQPRPNGQLQQLWPPGNTMQRQATRLSQATATAVRKKRSDRALLPQLLCLCGVSKSYSQVPSFQAHHQALWHLLGLAWPLVPYKPKWLV